MGNLADYAESPSIYSRFARRDCSRGTTSLIGINCWITPAKFAKHRYLLA